MTIWLIFSTIFTQIVIYMKTKLLKKLRKEVRKYVYLQCVEVDLSLVEIVVDNPFVACNFPHGKSYVSDFPEAIENSVMKYGWKDSGLHLIRNRAMSKGFTLKSEESIDTLNVFRRKFIIGMVKKIREDNQREIDKKTKIKKKKKKKRGINKILRKIYKYES